jgi:hypothetical protein
MLLGGKGGCQQCTCVPCDACTRTCQNPYTGTEFKPVYTRYFEAVEAGDPSDGYLSATGDSDTSDPYNGMDGSGPWSQQVSGSFTLDSTQTRFPCRVTVSFWRNQYGVGVQSIPPPSTALTFQGVFVTVSSGAVVVGDRVIVPADGEVQITTISIPLVTGGGDQSGNIPLFYDGSISVAPRCESASFSIRARIEWNTQRRQHVLYGLVRECYEEGTPCATFCSGSAPPNTIYLTISNVSVTAIASGSYGSAVFGAGAAGADAAGNVVEQTYVLDRVPNVCSAWTGSAPGGECDPPFSPGIVASVSATSSSGSGLVSMNTGRGNDCAGSFGLRFTFSGAPLPICGTWSRSGTSTDIRNDDAIAGSAVFTGSFDWSIYT